MSFLEMSSQELLVRLGDEPIGWLRQSGDGRMQFAETLLPALEEEKNQLPPSIATCEILENLEKVIEKNLKAVHSIYISFATTHQNSSHPSSTW
ncbi:MAG: hypothetical protein H7Y37_01285 [Anaerolineae bacterium]|nr:hypothetical protein [Gloeobacterales cyanobacterium ES-bin-313]